MTQTSGVLSGRSRAPVWRRLIKSLAKFSAVTAGFLAVSASAAHAAPTHLQSTASLIFFTPFDGFMNEWSSFMSSTVAKVGSVTALIFCGYEIGTGKPTAKATAGAAAVGVIIANAAPQIVTWISSLIGS